MTWRVTFVAVLALAGALIFNGCGSDGSSSSGSLSLSITDAPVDDAAGFYVTFTSFRLQGIDGSADLGPFPIPEEYQLVNLMDYQGNESATLVTDLTMPAGNYKLRLDADLSFDATAQASWIEFDGDADECEYAPEGTVWVEAGEDSTCRYPVEIPSEEQSWFKPKGDVTVVAGGSSSFTIEFDLRKNVVNPSNENNIAYKLKPTGLRLVNDTEVGSISGMIDAALFLETNCSVLSAYVYLYDREGAIDPFIPDDIHDGNTSYVTSVSVMTVAGDPDTYHYTIGFILPGTYGVAMLCSDVVDTPDGDELLDFAAQADGVVVTANVETIQDLSVPTP